MNEETSDTQAEKLEQMRMDGLREAKAMRDAEMRKKAEAQKAKEEKLKGDDQRKLNEYEQCFLGETPRHKAIRKELMDIYNKVGKIPEGPNTFELGKKAEKLKEKIMPLLKEYVSIPYDLGSKKFRLMLAYETPSQEIQCFSRNGGKTWQLIEVSDHIGRMTQMKLVTEDNLPSKIQVKIRNAGIARLFNGDVAMPAEFKLDLEDPSEEEPKSESKLRRIQKMFKLQ